MTIKTRSSVRNQVQGEFFDTTLTGSQNTEETDPGQPRNAPESLDTCESKGDNGSDGHVDRGTRRMRRNGVETDGDSQHSRASHKDPPYDGLVRKSSDARGTTNVNSQRMNAPPNK